MSAPAVAVCPACQDPTSTDPPCPRCAALMAARLDALMAQALAPRLPRTAGRMSAPPRIDPRS